MKVSEIEWSQPCGCGYEGPGHPAASTEIPVSWGTLRVIREGEDFLVFQFGKDNAMISSGLMTESELNTLLK